LKTLPIPYAQKAREMEQFATNHVGKVWVKASERPQSGIY
jgi:hypothetical protein